MGTFEAKGRLGVSSQSPRVRPPLKRWMEGTDVIAGQVLDDVSEAIAAIYGNHFDVQYTAVKTYLTENLLVCVLEDLGSDEDRQSLDGDLVVRRRQDFQRRHELEFRDAVKRLTGRRVKTFLSANHVGDGVAAEVFFLEPVASAT